MRKFAIFIALSCAMIIILCGSVSASDAPSANFTANTTNGYAPLSVHFTDKSTNNPTSWNWEFGDGQTSSVKNPTHTYTTVGAYSVKLTATNDAGSSTLTKKNYITAWNTSAPFKSNNGLTFYVANDAGVKYDMPNGVNQQGDYQSVYVNNSYFISRGGGGMNPIQISTDPNNKVGTKTTTTSQSGTFWVVFSGGIQHMDDAILMLAVNGTIPDDFTFHVTSTGYTYDLPAPALSNPATSTLTNVQYVTGVNETFGKNDFIYGPQSWKPTNTANYPIYQGQDPLNNFSLMFIDLDVGAFATNAYPGVTNGSIQVDYSFSNLESFAAFGAYGWFSACNWGTGIPMASNIAQGGYNVAGSQLPPRTSFTSNVTTGTAPLDVKFTDKSTGTVTGWNWDFGDGTTSTEQNPNHTYSTPGTYIVTFTATNEAGNNVTTQTITVNYPAPVADFVGNTTSGIAPLDVKFTDKSTGTVTGWNWDFGDGTTSTEQNPNHTYNAPGTYTVVLTVTGPGGDNTQTFTNYITVNYPAPVADFVGNTTSGIAPLDVKFTDKSTGTVTGWNWNFGDGTTSTEQNPNHTYNAPGTYTVVLTVTGPGGDKSIIQTNYITVNYPAPTAGFDTNITSGTAPLDVKFTDKSTGTVTGWNWDFGDGTTSAEQNPTHIYTKAGTYTVKLTVTNHGSSTVQNKIITVIPDTTKPTAKANLKGGIYNTNKSVTLSMNEPGSIYYTTNGTIPTTASKMYTSPISIASTTILNFFALDTAGNKSPGYKLTYIIDKIPPTASANLKCGLYNTNKIVKLNMNEPGSIYYTTNGTIPTTMSKMYTSPISITSTTILKFFALDNAGNKSPGYKMTYNIDKAAPKVTSTTPKNGSKNFSTTSSITIKFNENIKSSANLTKIYMKNLTTGLLVSIKTTIKNNQLNIKMTHKRYSNNLYQIYVPAGAVKDNAGNNLTTACTLKFKTK